MCITKRQVDNGWTSWGHHIYLVVASDESALIYIPACRVYDIRAAFFTNNGPSN